MWRQLGERIRVLRRQLRLTQAQLATMARVSASSLGRIERGEAGTVALGTVDRVVSALGARLRVRIEWHGEVLDRLADAAHAELQNAFADLLRAAGWSVAVEVSFNHYGDRGRCDVLAFHPATGILAVVEVKTAIGDVQDLLGRLDTKSASPGCSTRARAGLDPARRSRSSCWPTSVSSTESSPTTPRSSPDLSCEDGPPVRGWGGPRGPADCSCAFR